MPRGRLQSGCGGATEPPSDARHGALMPVHLYGQTGRHRCGSAASRPTRACGSSRTRARPTARARRVRAGVGAIAAAFSFYPGKNLGACGTPARSPRTTSARGARAGAARARAAAQVPARLRGLDGPARHDPGARASPEAALAGRLERPAARGGCLHRRPGGVGDLACLACPRAASPSGTSSSCARPSPRRSPPSSATAASRPALPAAAAPVRRLPALGHRRGDFPVAERVGREVLSLPIFPGITEAQVQAVVEGVRAYFAAAS